MNTVEVGAAPFSKMGPHWVIGTTYHILSVSSLV